MGKPRKLRTMGVRMDDEIFEKLQLMAKETDRTMGSVIRILIRLAEGKPYVDLFLPFPNDDGRTRSQDDSP